MPSAVCETSSRVHLKFKPSSTFNIEDVVKKSLPNGSIILKNHNHRNPKRAHHHPEMFFAIAQIASQTLPAVGMLNTHNNCYINASLQVLLRMPVFGATITKVEHNHCRLQFCMINFLKNVLKKLSQGERVAISLLLENIRAINKDFRRGQQEDAHEMILSILEYIRSELRCNHRSEAAPEQDAWCIKTIDSTLFTKFRQSIRCFSCGNISVTNTSDAFVVVGCGASLVMALKKHFATEVLEGDCAYHCDKCRAKVRAAKRLAIDEPGEYFAIQLSRFHYDGYKNSSYVPFPETINLTEFTENPKGPPNDYALFATIIHEGDSTRSGHYLSIVKVNNKYKIFNDLDVDDTSWRELQYTRPYIIIYAKVHRLVRQANVLKRKLEVHSESPSIKKPLNTYNIYSIKTVDNRALGSAAVAVTTCPPQSFAAQATSEAFRDERGRVSTTPRAAPKLVWHRQIPAAPPAPSSAPVPRKAQVILSQEPPEEIQNIAPKRAFLSNGPLKAPASQENFRDYRPLMQRPAERSENGGDPSRRVQKVVRPAASDFGMCHTKQLIIRPLQRRPVAKDIENRPHSHHSGGHQSVYLYKEVMKHNNHNNNNNNYYKHVHSGGQHYNGFHNGNGFYGSKLNKNAHLGGHYQHNGFHGGYKYNSAGEPRHLPPHHHHHNGKEHSGKGSVHNGRHHNHYHFGNGLNRHFSKNYQQRKRSQI